MKSGKVVLNLKQFMLRRQTLDVYKQLMRFIYKIEDSYYKEELVRWTRSDFRANKGLTDEESIKMALTRAKRSLDELATSMNMAK